MTAILLLLVLTAAFDLPGERRSSTSDQFEVISGEWETVNDVRKLYDTPAGAVYQFGLSVPWKCTPCIDSKTRRLEPGKHKLNDREMRSGIKGVLLASFGRKKLKRKRFVVLDFTIRAFPAIVSNKTSSFQFQIVRSDKTQIRSDYRDVTGIVFTGTSPVPSLSTEFVLPPNFGMIKTEGIPYNPHFGLYSFRVIFDTYTGRDFTIIRNGYHMTLLHPEAPVSGRPIEINSLGIISQNRGGNRERRRKYFEISAPTIYRFSSEKLLKELPPLNAGSYPYDSYKLTDSRGRPVPAELEWRKLKNNDNPDLQYAYALRRLYGNDCNPSRALDLLEDAAKKNHALANYELGVCYDRGYGVTQNWKKADKYLERAETLGYSKATALRNLMGWELRNRPKFYDRKPWNNAMSESLEASGKSMEHDNSVYYSFFSLVADHFIFEYSPKRFPLGFWGNLRYLFQNFPNADQIVERDLAQNRNSGYIPACLTEAQYLEFRKKDKARIIRLLRTGSDAGDLECRSKLLSALAENGNPPKEMFTPLNDLLLSDDPVYLLFDYALKHPNEPGITEFLRSDCKTAEQIWNRRNTPESGYLSALLTWSRVYPYGRRHGVPLHRKKVGDSAAQKRLDAERRQEEMAASVGFKKLKVAAKAGIAPAMYLVAKQYRDCDYPANDDATSDSEARSWGEWWLQKAAKTGSAQARFLCLEEESGKAMTGRLKQMLTEVETFCKANYPPAFLLKAEILDRLNRPETVAAYEAAASRGEYRAWRILALKQESLKNENAANEYWKKFIEADREHRRQDRYDIFYPQIKVDTKLQPWMMSPEEEQEYRDRLKETLNIDIADE